MTSEKIKTANQVLTRFLSDGAKDDALDGATISAIVNLREEGKLTRINLLRRLEEARNAALDVEAPTKREN